MSINTVVIYGVVQPDGSLQLEGKVPLPAGKVQITLQTVPELPAGEAVTRSGKASTRAAKTDSAIRWLTSAAQPDTGRGYCASRNVPSGVLTRSGSKAPALIGTSGKICRMAR